MLRAEVYKTRAGRWHWVVYDTDRHTVPLAHGRYPANQWREAYDEACKQLFELRFRDLQERINAAIARSIFAPIAPQRFWLGMPKTWEGDYA